MNFIDYKIAAERHLETCLSLEMQLTTFEQVKQKKSIKQKEEDRHQNLLANLYYLSGYMLECLYSYAMCKYEGLSAIADVKGVLDARGHSYNLCFNHTKRTRLGVRYSITRDKHQMSMSELAFFETAGIVSAGSIPLLDNTTQLSSMESQKLFENWSAYERYKINHFSSANFPPFDYNNVIQYFWEIVDVCSQISKDIIREITLFRRAIKKRPSQI